MFNLGRSIAQKLDLVVILAALLGAGTLAAFFYSFQALVSARSQMAKVADVSRGVSELMILTQELRGSGSKRAINQWQARHLTLVNSVDNWLVPEDLRERKEEIFDKLEVVKSRFSELERALGVYLAMPSEGLRMKLNQIEMDFLYHLHEMSAMARGLSEVAERRANRIHYWNLIVLIVWVSLVTLTITVLIRTVKTRFQASMAALESRVQNIGEGRFEVLSGDMPTDEFGRLSQHFEAMAANLRERYQQLVEDANRARQDAERASKAKSDFLANMSHELRTPLNVIHGYAQLLEESDAATRADYLAKIEANVRFTTELIDDILDLSKIEAGKLTLDRKKICLGGTLSTVIDSAEHRAKEKGLHFEVRYGTRVPGAITTDETRLKQILTNIIGNAIKFTDKGSVMVSISMDGDRLRAVVTDTGIGIADEKKGLLFSKFVQADEGITRRFGGTGLGLALSKRFAKMLGGDVELLESSPGKGSTFLITIDPTPYWGDIGEYGFPGLNSQVKNDSFKNDQSRSSAATLES